jgi:diguanylate cyclase (GGDEF)-like protein
LSTRLSDLSTLHSISREIVASMDQKRIFAGLERECRKSFDVDFFFIALLDRESGQLRVVYHRRGLEPPQETLHPPGSSLASWVATSRRCIRVDDFQGDPGRLPFRPLVVDPEIRSALAVPLVVEDRVIGVLSVQSRRVAAYDEHQLSLLFTVGHHAAVAIENSRHFEMATIDSLTGVFLRDYFFRRLEEETLRIRRYGGEFVLLMLDLDGFKAINDCHGHQAGDRYLSALGAEIRERLRSADLACRYGGDEFCLLLPETSAAGAAIIAERLRIAVSRVVVEADGVLLRTTASVGLAAFSGKDATDMKSLVRRADEALYAAKRAGRDRVVSSAA